MNLRGWALSLVTLLSSAAFAHDLDLTVVKIALGNKETRVEVTTPLSRFVRVHQMGANPSAPDLDLAVRKHIDLRSATGAQLKVDSRADLLTWTATAPGEVHPKVDSFDTSTESAQTLVTIYEDGRLKSESVIGQAPSASAQDTETDSGSLARLGFEHILAGLDHILFVVGLALMGGGWKTLFKVLTAFTVSHSITLGAAATGWLHANPRVVEPLIALSIVALAVEGIRRRQASAANRPSLQIALAFGFGLVHGLGFAGGLTDLGLQGSALIQGLTAFSLGIEMGQIAVLLSALGGLAFLAKIGAREVSARRLERFSMAATIGLGMIGSYWFVERLL